MTSVWPVRRIKKREFAGWNLPIFSLFFRSNSMLSTAQDHSFFEASFTAAMDNQKLNISDVNEMSREDFGALLGPFFNATPEIVEGTWEKHPFSNLEEIYFSLCDVSLEAGNDAKLRLLRNFPDFVLELQVDDDGGSAHSISAIAGAGLRSLSGEEYSRFFHLNGAYRGVYGIPFILYLPEHDSVESIFENFALRLQNRRDEEVDVALEEAMKFAWLRLNLFVDNG